MAGITNASRSARLLPRRTAAGAVRQRDDHLARAGRAQRRVDAPDPARPDETPRSHPALRRRPGHRRRARSGCSSTEDRADHIDLNFGCPVPKVTRKGGGSGAAVEAPACSARSSARRCGEAAPYDVPVTVKMRKGIDDDHLTYLDAGRIAEAEGVAAVALHARTAAQSYSGTADWDGDRRAQGGRHEHPGARQRRHLVGRATRVRDGRAGPGATASSSGAAAWAGRGCSPTSPRPSPARPSGSGPTLGRGRRRRCAGTPSCSPSSTTATAQGLPRHPQAHRLVPQGLPGRPPRRATSSALVESLAALDDLIATLDLSQPWPGEPAEGQRGRAGSPRTVALPEGWLDSRELDAAARASVAQAELSVSGG